MTSTLKRNGSVIRTDAPARVVTVSAPSTVTFLKTAGEWDGICLPFSVSESEAKRVFGEGYILLTCDGVTDNRELHFVRHANRYIEAGRPYLIKPMQDGTFSFKNVTVEGAETVTTLAGASVRMTDPLRFNVDVKRETIPQYSYYAKGEGLYKSTTPTASGKIGGYRAYFQLQEDNAGGETPVINSLSFTFEDLTPNAVEKTGTGLIIIDEKNDKIQLIRNDSNSVYNINGQKMGEGASFLQNARKGIYIIDGRKYIK